MKSFREQFVECSKAKLNKKGKLQKFKDFPELLPPFWHPAYPKFMKALKENPNDGLTPLMCLKFGGQCYSGNPRCLALRNMSNGLLMDITVNKNTLTQHGDVIAMFTNKEQAEAVWRGIQTLDRISKQKPDRVTDT